MLVSVENGECLWMRKNLGLPNPIIPLEHEALVPWYDFSCPSLFTTHYEVYFMRFSFLFKNTCGSFLFNLTPKLCFGHSFFYNISIFLSS